MVEAAGAMAMFVLRLAGLLSLENALQNNEANLTDAPFNVSALPFGEDLAYQNFTWLLPTNDSQPTDVGTSPTQLPTEPIGNAPFTTTPSASSTPFASATPRAPPTTIHISKDVSSQPTPSPITDQTSTKRTDAEENYEVMSSTIIAGGESSRHRAGDADPSQLFDDKKDGEEVALTGSPLSHLPRASPLSDTRPSESPVTQANYFEIEEVEEEVEDGDTEEEEENEEEEEEQEEDDGDGEEKEGEQKDQEGIAVDINESKHVTSSTPQTNIDDSIPSVSPPPVTSTPSSGEHTPHLEELLEDDSLISIVNDNDFAGLEAPPEDFIPNEFEYYDFGPQETTGHVNPTLSSMNLVSPVPRGGPRPDTSYDWGGFPDESDYPARTRTVSPPRPVPPVYPRNYEGSNNPYPYGPRLLPGPYAPLTPNLPHANEDQEGDLYHRETEYDYEEFEYYYDSEEDSKFEVQTKEPPVLFVFDKPGYSPEAPTTLVPPSRAPTPSDPWDCAPRCPRYTLLDWNTDYDVRHYPDTSWVSTVIISDNRVLAELEGYMRVQDYFYGLNDQGLVLNLTIPFVTQIKFGKHPGVLAETNDYTISLYVQPAYYLHTDSPPTPISNEVLVDNLEPKTVFVHNFEANVWDVTEAFLEEKVNTLMSQLRQNGEAFLDRSYYLASYSRPELYQPVYYEIWIYATNFRDPQVITKSLGGPRNPEVNKITKKTLNKLCRGVECPSFEVLRTYKYGIQKRRYYDGLFASTTAGECEFTTMSVWKGFMPLHLYKHGINSHMEVIEATRPIALVHVRDSTESMTECPQNMTMSLYLPKRLHSNPPVTGYAAPSVRITALNDVIVYAYTVGGYLLDPMRVRRELADMKYRLSEFGECYKDDEYYVVIYDFIVRYHGRQNEIWIVAENCKATHNG